jgi:hypothetical protein
VDNVADRKEDMSQRGRLRVILQDDGDVVICTQGMDRGLRQPGSPVEFCTPMGGGGKSPHTHKALIALFRAMQLDNEENPTPEGDG